MKRFLLNRTEDESGISGTGVVAEGVLFSSGECVLHWLTQVSSIALYRDLDALILIHGHNGKTQLEWIDNEDSSGYSWQ